MGIIFNGGSKDIYVPQGQKIAINCENGTAIVYYSTSPNSPDLFYEQTRITNSTSTLGTFVNDRIIRVEAYGDSVTYDVAVSPAPLPIDHNDLMSLQGGTTDEYYHLTSNEYIDFQSMNNAGLEDLTSSEVSQLANIGATLISSTQWGYLGALNQSLSTSDSVSFSVVSASLLGELGTTSRNNAQFLTPVNAQTGTTYTVQESDTGKMITLSNASSITVTLPQQSTETTSVGMWLKIRNIGAGTVTLVKEGSETLSGNVTLVTDAECVVFRTTTTSWSVFGGTAILNRPGIHLNLDTITTSETITLVGYAGTDMTILGVYQKARALSTAGTFAIKINGTDITGLGAVVPSTSGSYTAATAANTVKRGDQITIVADGTLDTVSDLAVSIDFTEVF